MGKTAVKGLFHLILIATTFALAVVTIIASRSGHYHPENSTIMPLLGLAVPVLLVSCLIVALCWALARRKWAFVTLAAFFFNWEYLTAVIRFGSPHEVPATEPAPNRQGENSGYLTVATYNVHNFGNEITGYSCKQIAKYMQQQHVDVLCFQEFGENKHFTADSLRRALSHWQYAIIPADDSIRGILPHRRIQPLPAYRRTFHHLPSQRQLQHAVRHHSEYRYHPLAEQSPANYQRQPEP